MKRRYASDNDFIYNSAITSTLNLEKNGSSPLHTLYPKALSWQAIADGATVEQTDHYKAPAERGSNKPTNTCELWEIPSQSSRQRILSCTCRFMHQVTYEELFLIFFSLEMIDLNNTDNSSQFETKGRPLIFNEKDVLDHVPNYHYVRNLISVFFF